jgi:hypothetical protein
MDRNRGIIWMGRVNMIDVDDQFHLFLQRRMRERERKRHRRAGRRIGIAWALLVLAILMGLAVHYMAGIGEAAAIAVTQQWKMVDAEEAAALVKLKEGGCNSIRCRRRHVRRCVRQRPL